MFFFWGKFQVCCNTLLGEEEKNLEDYPYLVWLPFSNFIDIYISTYPNIYLSIYLSLSTARISIYLSLTFSVQCVVFCNCANLCKLWRTDEMRSCFSPPEYLHPIRNISLIILNTIYNIIYIIYMYIFYFLPLLW